MKSIFFACFMLLSSVTFAQNNKCNLWLGDVADSSTSIKQFAEQILEIQTRLLPSDNPNIQDMRDDNELLQVKVWLKPTKKLVNGAMATVYTISSFKIVSLSDKIDEIYAALGSKVKACTTEATAMNTVFGNRKMFIERTGGGFGPKNLPMATVTVTVN